MCTSTSKVLVTLLSIRNVTGTLILLAKLSWTLHLDAMCKQGCEVANLYLAYIHEQYCLWKVRTSTLLLIETLRYRMSIVTT